MIRYILPCLMLLVACPVLADEAPPAVSMGSKALFTFCDAQAGTVDCVGPGGDEAVLDTAGWRSIVFDASQSASTTFTCTVVGNNVGHDAGGGDGQTLPTTDMSDSQFSIELSDTPRFIWITCSANNVSATITGFARR